MKITKKSFVNAMVENYTTFVGTSHKLFEKDELYCKIRDLFAKDIILEKRSCVARSKDLVFSGDSHLYFQKGDEFYKYEYPEGTIYVCCHNDTIDDEPYILAMYYLVK